MATSNKVKEKAPMDIVHQNAIHVETIRKEQRCQKLYTEFTINPFKKWHVLPDKPMSRKMHEDVEEDQCHSNETHDRTGIQPAQKLWLFQACVSDIWRDRETSAWAQRREEYIRSAFLNIIHEAHTVPTKKYTHPMTESQEIGWISAPLIASDHTDRRLNFPRHNSEITKYMDAAWRLKEQTQNLG